MSKYTFRFETLKKIRETTRDEHRVQLAQAYQAEEIVNEEHVKLSGQVSQLQAMRRAASSQEKFDVNQLIELGRYEVILKAQEHSLVTQQAMIQTETERRRQILIASDREVQILEKLDEKHFQEYQTKQQQLETKQLDEVGSVGHWRNSAGRTDMFR